MRTKTTQKWNIATVLNKTKTNKYY